MDNNLKFYLLAEKSGWNCSTYAFEYRKKLQSLSSYQILSYNVIEARKHLSKEAKAIVSEYDGMKLEPRTLEECFITETKINYLCLHSFPEYYINPLSINPEYKGEITTIGDLMINVQGKDMRINEMIMDEKIASALKKEAVRDRINDYVSDMNGLVGSSIRNIQRNTKKNKGQNKIAGIIPYIELTLFIILNFFFFFILLYPQNHYWECFYNPKSDYVMTYISYLLPTSILIYDFFFSLFHTVRASINEPIRYARRFLKYHSEKIYDDILLHSEKLYDYLSGAINNHLRLQNDIHDFSRLSTSYIDFDKVEQIPYLKKKKGYKAIRTLCYIFTTLASLIGFFSFIIYLYSSILNITI